jgi:LPPG:FO 2-phospho-L-lactate transferase
VIVALAGGVGAARLLRGLVDVVDTSEIVAVVNTADDVVLHGLHISPDLDTVTYTLAGAINPETGWGLAGETWAVMDALAAFGSGDLAWFRLGDRDLGTHLYRTSRLQAGATLTEVVAEIAQRWGVGVRLLPVSDDRIETRVTVAGTEIGFQEYFVGRQHAVAVSAVRFAGIDQARPAPGVLDAVAAADMVVVCPSNPIVSIGPVLGVPGVREAVMARREAVVAISPIIAGAALKGPADRMLSELGHQSSVVGVARLYADIAATLVIDEADADLAGGVEEAGLRCVVAPTVMSGPMEAAALARAVLGASGQATWA